MVDHFNQDQIDELRKAFKLGDPDDDGTVATGDLGCVMRCLRSFNQL